jgi:hypothetical protein
MRQTLLIDTEAAVIDRYVTPAGSVNDPRNRDRDPPNLAGPETGPPLSAQPADRPAVGPSGSRSG